MRFDSNPNSLAIRFQPRPCVRRAATWLHPQLSEAVLAVRS
jgi:hypothetical protein